MLRTSPRPWRRFVLGGIVCALTTAGLLAQAKNPAPASRGTLPHPVLDVKEFMEVFNKPWYDDLKKDLATRPSEDEEW